MQRYLGIDENRNLTIDENDVQLASKKKQILSGVSIIGQFRANRLAVQAGVGYELINDGKFYYREKQLKTENWKTLKP